MAHQSALIATDVEAYLAEHERKDLLRLLTCGSVDDGKSTLIGRLLHDSNLIYEDQLQALESDSVVSGTTGDRVDLALLMDGLKAEREQGITIDVAYRYFSTDKRKFIIADAPGHAQYTRNMVTGASQSELAVILIDARYGVLDQTRRHTYIASLLGIQHVVVAVNKMDLVGWSKDRFDEVVDDYLAMSHHLGVHTPYFLPMSALEGDNVVEPSSHMPWFEGPPLLIHLESVDVAATVDLERLRLPIQQVVRPDRDFRGFSGTIASGVLRPGQEVVAVPSGVRSRVERIVTFDGDLDIAGPGQAVTLTLEDEIDLSRGDLLVDADHQPLRAHDVEATVVWMSTDEAEAGRQLLLQSVGGVSNASLRGIHDRVDMENLERIPAERLRLNDVAHCSVSVDRELLFDPYQVNPVTGSFILVDRLSNVTVGAGMITGIASGWDFEPATSLQSKPSAIDLDERVTQLDQHPATVLMTGMTGAGKSTVAQALERRLFDRGNTVLRLDGENLRVGISRDLGFSYADRSESLRRAAEIARLANSQGLVTLVAVQAPAGAVRDRIRDLIGADRYVEVYLDAAEEIRRARDPYGLYRAADQGEVEHLPGVTTEYQEPTNPDLTLDTGVMTVEDCVDAIVEVLVQRGFLRER